MTRRCGTGTIEAAFRALDPARANVIIRAFHVMTLAEQAIETTWPDGDAPRDAFLLSRPDPILYDKGDALYLAHLRELYARLRAGAQPPAIAALTEAEALAMLAQQCLKHPFNRDAELVFEHLFARVLPELARKLDVTSALDTPEGRTHHVLAIEFLRELLRRTNRDREAPTRNKKERTR